MIHMAHNGDDGGLGLPIAFAEGLFQDFAVKDQAYQLAFFEPDGILGVRGEGQGFKHFLEIFQGDFQSGLKLFNGGMGVG